ncbi:hypothetical protein BTA51_04080 [Hahella sp. CCB-MM4]|nr:hypothetical protein BTA51_04080 [Hahella sp. CCB-MM4]
MNLIWIERIRDRMQATGITQNDLARALGCTRGAVGHYLAGRRKPSLDQLEIMAKTLSVSPAWLQYDIGPMDVQESPGSYTVEPMVFPLSGDVITGPLDKPVDDEDGVSIPADCYALVVKGAELSPRMYEGDVLLISPKVVPTPGSHVYVRYRSGEAMVLTLVSQGEKEVVLEPLLTKQSRMVRQREDIESMHSVVAVVYRNN